MSNEFLRTILVFFSLNLVSFFYLRLVAASQPWGVIPFTNPSPRLLLEREPAPGHPMYYLIAGNLNQADTAFRSLLDTIPAQAGIIFVNYRSTGYLARAVEEIIRRDSQKYASFNIIAISQGAQPALALADRAEKVYLINPCVRFDFLQNSQKPLVKIIGTWALGIACIPLGFISIVPILGLFKSDWQGYSLFLLQNQYQEICYHHNPKTDFYGELPVYPTKPSLDNIGVIISDQDEILNNQVIRDYFTDCAEIVSIPTPHGDTEHYAEEYHKGLQHLMDTMG